MALKTISDISARAAATGFTTQALGQRSGQNWVADQLAPDRVFWSPGTRTSDFSVVDPYYRLVDADGVTVASVPMLDNTDAPISYIVVDTARALILGCYADAYATLDTRILLLTFDETTGGGSLTDTGYSMPAGTVVVGDQPVVDANGFAIVGYVDNLTADGDTKVLVIDTGLVSGSISVRQTGVSGVGGVRFMGIAQPLPSGLFYCANWIDFNAGNASLTAKYLDPVTLAWTAAPAYQTTELGALVVGTDALYLMGSAGGAPYAKFDVNSLAWSVITSRPLGGVGYLRVTPDGRILDLSSTGATKNYNHLYDPKTDTWVDLGQYPASTSQGIIPRTWHFSGASGARVLNQDYLSPYNYTNFIDFTLPGQFALPAEAASADALEVVPRSDPGIGGLKLLRSARYGTWLAAPGLPALGSNCRAQLTSITLHSLEA